MPNYLREYTCCGCHAVGRFPHNEKVTCQIYPDCTEMVPSYNGIPCTDGLKILLHERDDLLEERTDLTTFLITNNHYTSVFAETRIQEVNERLFDVNKQIKLYELLLK